MITSCVPVMDQHVFGFVQVSVVALWFDSKQMTHEWVHVNQVKGINHEVFLKIRPHGPEEGFHIHGFVVKAVIAFVELHRKKLEGK